MDTKKEQHVKIMQFLAIGSLVLYGALSVLMTPNSYAAETPSRGIAREGDVPVAEDDEYNFSWLDTDKKVYVLQNRKYRKKNHVAVFLEGTMNLSNPYRFDYGVLPRFDFWFTEQFGVEAFFSMHNNSDTSTLTELKSASPTSLPFVREVTSYYGLAGTWTPWYSKLNFFNKILYYDWFFILGGGLVNTKVDRNTRADQARILEAQSAFGIFYGTGMNFFVTQHFSVRLDFLGMMYSAEKSDSRTTTRTANYDMALGVGYLF